MAKRSHFAASFTKPPHVSDRAWALASGMSLRQLAGQLTSIDPGRYQALAGELPQRHPRGQRPGAVADVRGLGET